MPGDGPMIFAAGGCDARVIPQANGFPVTVLPVIRLSWVGPVSSLARIPPELKSTRLFATIEWSTAIRWMPSPQSMASDVSNAGRPMQVAAVGFRLLLLFVTWFCEMDI